MQGFNTVSKRVDCFGLNIGTGLTESLPLLIFHPSPAKTEQYAV